MLAERLESEQRNLLAADELNPEEKKIYELSNAEEPRQIEDLVEKTWLNSSRVLATLFNLEMKGIIRHLPGKLMHRKGASAHLSFDARYYKLHL